MPYAKSEKSGHEGEGHETGNSQDFHGKKGMAAGEHPAMAVSLQLCQSIHMVALTV